MDLSTGEPSRDLFGGEVPAAVRALIDASREVEPAARGAILWTAQALSPDCLPVYYLLYKWHASRAELDRAEQAARAGLAVAGQQTGLPQQAPEPVADFVVPCGVDFSVPGAARFWLFTLKALAFIRARRGDLTEARQLLALIAHCDPESQRGQRRHRCAGGGRCAGDALMSRLRRTSESAQRTS